MSSVEEVPVEKVRKLRSRNKVTVLIGAYYNILLAKGFSFSVSTLFIQMLESFNASRKDTALIASFSMGCTLGIGLFSGIAVHKVGSRCVMLVGALLSSCALFASWFATSVPYLIITVGVLTGIGNSFVYISTNVVVAATFEDRRPVVMTSLMIVSGVACLIWPYVLTVLANTFGWRGCFLVITGVYLNILVTSLLMTSPLGNNLYNVRSTQGQEKKPSGSIAWKKLLDPMFAVYLVMAALSIGTGNSVRVVFMDLLKSRGISEETSLVLLTVFNTLSIVQRYINGGVKFIHKFSSLGIFCICGIVSGGSVLVIATVKNYTIFVIFLSLCGAGYGGMVGLTNSVPLEILGLEMLGISFGIATMIVGIFSPVASATIGWIYDTRGSYDFGLAVFGGIAVSSAAVAYTYFLIQSYWLQRHKKDDLRNGNPVSVETATIAK